MNLILVRHAEAVDIGSSGVRTDFDRHLTDRGREQANRLADALAERGVVVGAVISSPLLRAQQTAEPLLKLYPNGSSALTFSEYLACGELRRRRLSRAVNELKVGAAILVGHNPDLEDYVGWLVGGRETSIRFEKGTAASIHFDGPIEQGAGSLVWLVPPVWVG